jgi:hypothetical protein
MNEFQTKYAMAKLLPEFTSSGCTIKTENHEIDLTPAETKKLRKALYAVLKARLEKMPAHGGSLPARGQASQMGQGASRV